MIVEEEDDECARLSKEREVQMILDKTKLMEEEEESWNVKKTRELILGEVKRRRPSDGGDVAPPGGGGLGGRA